jgi:hypothetical protein
LNYFETKLENHWVKYYFMNSNCGNSLLMPFKNCFALGLFSGPDSNCVIIGGRENQTVVRVEKDLIYGTSVTIKLLYSS